MTYTGAQLRNMVSPRRPLTSRDPSGGHRVDTLPAAADIIRRYGIAAPVDDVLQVLALGIWHTVRRHEFADLDSTGRWIRIQGPHGQRGMAEIEGTGR